MVSKESGLITETRKYADIFTPSPLEEAFDAEIQRRFHTALLGPVVDAHGRLVRVSYPVVFGDANLVAFQYTRYDLLNGDQEDVVETLLPHNLSIRSALGEVEYPNSMGEEGWSQKLMRAINKEDVIIKAIKQRIIERDGEISSQKALSDPAYYTDGIPLEQWPECFEFVIFDASNPSGEHVPPTRIEPRGKLAGKRASVYGRLSIPSYFKDEISPRRQHEVQLVISFPQLYYKSAQAYVQVFGGDLQSYRHGNLDVDDYQLFAHQDIQIPLWISHSQEDIQKVIGGIGGFVDRLAQYPTTD